MPDKCNNFCLVPFWANLTFIYALKIKDWVIVTGDLEVGLRL